MSQTTTPLEQLIARYDPKVFGLGRPEARVRLEGPDIEAKDVLLDGHDPRLVPADTGQRPDAVLTADADTWAEIAQDVRGGMAAYRSGRLRIRHDLHLGVGFLAATADSGEHGLRFRRTRSPSTSRASVTRSSRSGPRTTRPTSPGSWWLCSMPWRSIAPTSSATAWAAGWRSRSG